MLVRLSQLVILVQMDITRMQQTSVSLIVVLASSEILLIRPVRLVLLLIVLRALLLTIVLLVSQERTSKLELVWLLVLMVFIMMSLTLSAELVLELALNVLEWRLVLSVTLGFLSILLEPRCLALLLALLDSLRTEETAQLVDLPIV